MTSSSSPVADVPDVPKASAGVGRDAPLRRLTARGRGESHRVASPLELFFDLCFVVAVAQAGAQLVHAVAEGHTGEGILNYAMVFFAIWWAWMNFTWFASAYDNDDVLYRVVTLVQIAGVLVLAAGVSRAFEDHDFLIVWLGYLIMRLPMAAQWLRAARTAAGAERTTALRYAGGVLLCMVGWAGLVVLPESGRPWVFLVMALVELAVPVYAEKNFTTSWHPHHISERYGLFTIIVLGEAIAAATVAVKSGVRESDALADLLPIAAGGLLIVFSAWWIYFAVPIHGRLRTSGQAFLWGYGHYLIFASAAVTVPAALYLVTVWALHSRYFKVGVAEQLVLPGAALLVLVCTFLGDWAVLAAGLVSALAVAAGVALSARTAAGEHGAKDAEAAEAAEEAEEAEATEEA
jgi:low temperature requirement protein LtrA